MGRLSTSSDVKAFAAAAFVLHVRVVELETLVQPLPREVQFRAVEIGEALRIDDDGDPVAVEAVVLRADLVGILELVGKTGATRGAHGEPQGHALAPSGKEARDVLRGGFGGGDGDARANCP